MKRINTSNMTPVDQIEAGDPGDNLSLKKLYWEAEKFLLIHPWCKKVEKVHMDIGIEGVLAVFLFQIVRESKDSDDSEVWVITGDLPPAYIEPMHAPNGACALLSYIGEMNLWVRAVKYKENLQVDYLPVNVSPTLEHANMLESRLRFIDEKILPHYNQELTEGGYKEDFSFFPHYAREDQDSD